MKRSSALSGAVLLCIGFAGPANATLWDRGGGLIYDDVLDITWLQDANYARTSGYDVDGEMTWDEAYAWVQSLVYGGYDDWRLPETLPVGGGTSYDHAYSYDGSTDRGYNVSAPGSAHPGTTTNEMAYLYYNDLGNLGYYDVNGVRDPNSGLKNVSFIDGATGETRSFLNVESAKYWSREDIRYDFKAWEFGFDGGWQWYRNKDGDADGLPGGAHVNHYAWAVRDGDVSALGTVPGPASLLLVASGLIGLAGFSRRKR